MDIVVHQISIPAMSTVGFGYGIDAVSMRATSGCHVNYVANCVPRDQFPVIVFDMRSRQEAPLIIFITPALT